MLTKQGWRVWKHGRNLGLTLVLALSLTAVQRPQERRQRYHSHTAVERPAVAAPMDGVGRADTRLWPHVPVLARALPDGWFYAVSPTEVAAALDAVPAAWRETVHGVLLCPSPDGEVMAETDGETIQLHYVVDRYGRAPVAPGEGADEEAEFGGIPEHDGARLWVLWPRRALLQTYVLDHLLMHEVGHHLAPSGLDDEQEERWAEAFAFRYYNPEHPNARFDSQARAPLY